MVYNAGCVKVRAVVASRRMPARALPCTLLPAYFCKKRKCRLFWAPGEIHGFYFPASRRCRKCAPVSPVLSKRLPVKRCWRIPFSSQRAGSLLRQCSLTGQSFDGRPVGKYFSLGNIIARRAQAERQTGLWANLEKAWRATLVIEARQRAPAEINLKTGDSRHARCQIPARL